MSKNSQFEKFINKKKGSALKEEIRQDKKAAKKEKAAANETTAGSNVLTWDLDTSIVPAPCLVVNVGTASKEYPYDNE